MHRMCLLRSQWLLPIASSAVIEGSTLYLQSCSFCAKGVRHGQKVWHVTCFSLSGLTQVLCNVRSRLLPYEELRTGFTYMSLYRMLVNNKSPLGIDACA